MVLPRMSGPKVGGEQYFFKSWMTKVGLQCVLLFVTAPILFGIHGCLLHMQHDGNALPVTTIAQSPTREQKRNEHVGPIMFSRIRTDRAGASIQDMLMAHAFAFSESVSYGGACHEGVNSSLGNNLPRLLESLGLAEILPFACPLGGNGMIVDFHNYYTKDTSIFTNEWLDLIRSRVKYIATHKKPGNTEDVAVHIRRGDVDPCQYPTRYLPNSYYLKVLDRLQNGKSTRYNITIYSGKESFEGWRDFESRGYGKEFSDDIELVWSSMLNADILVMSKSSFSLVPAVLSRGTVIYTPFWHKPLAQWQVVEKGIVSSIAQEVENLRQQCSHLI
mmetsp:Transcript_6464/g.8396  ORF Transcript_6464/g.8396 Transcript_6464/m.8396 type:complete len:332 (+) Transcript_6464:71-1066(+)